MPSLLDPEAYGFANPDEDRRKKLSAQDVMSALGGLLSQPVDYVKGRATSLLTDPIGDIQRTLQGTVERAKARDLLTQQAYGDPSNPLRVTDQAAADQLANEYLDMASTIMPMGMTVYHGSPYKFSAFDPTKIGSGEGAQAYAYGHYSAQAKPTAEQYQKTVSRDMFDVGGEVFNPSVLKHLNVRSLANRGDLDNAIAKAEQIAKSDSPSANLAAQDLAVLNQVKEAGGLKPLTGNLYKIDLPDEQIAKMLDWDTELGKQTKEVQDLAKKYGLGMDDLGGDLIVAMDAKRAAGAEAMRQAGIPGVKYLDEASRGSYKARTTYKGQPYGDLMDFRSQNTLDDYIKQKRAEGFDVEVMPGTSNFVVFPKNEGLLKIEEVNGQPVQGGLLSGAPSNSLSDIERKFGDVSLDVYEKNGTINLSRIVVPKEMRNTGVGTQVMDDLVSYADATGQKIALTPSSDFGGNEKKLKEFYKRFGFVENKGRNKDFTTRETMIRPAR